MVYLADPAVTVRLILWVACMCVCISVIGLVWLNGRSSFFGVTVTTENDYFVLVRWVSVHAPPSGGVKLLNLRNAYVRRDAL